MSGDTMQNDKANVAAIYDDRADEYEADTASLSYFKAAVQAFLAENVRSGQRILDLGCGPGHLTGDLPPDVDVVGLDLSPRMIEEAQKTRPTDLYLVHDFHHPISTALGTFDLILASSCFDFCEDVARVMRNVAGALRPGGRAYFTIDERRPEIPFHGDRSVDVGGGHMAIRIFFWSFAETAAAIEAAGLRPVTYRHGPGWESRGLNATIHYGYWIVERPSAKLR